MKGLVQGEGFVLFSVDGNKLRLEGLGSCSALDRLSATGIFSISDSSNAPKPSQSWTQTEPPPPEIQIP